MTDDTLSDENPPKKATTLIEGTAREVSPPTSSAQGEEPLASHLKELMKAPMRLGAATLIGFFGVFGTWAALMPLAGAAVAPAVISPEGNRRVVQHLEGGIIEAIHAVDGDLVEPGAPLVTLSDLEAKTSFQLLNDQFIRLVMKEHRLLTELRESTFTLPEALTPVAADPLVKRAFADETSLLEARRESRASVADVLGKRIDQLQAEIDGMTALVATQVRSMDLVREELTGTRTLFEKGLAPKTELLALERALSAIEGQQASSKARIARAKQGIGETELQIVAQNEDFRTRLTEELSLVRAELDDVKGRMPLTEDVLERTVLRAPVGGQVVAARFSTLGGIVQPGEPILEIVPSELDLLVEARVDPRDIEKVYPGLQAQVILSAYSQRDLPRLFGQVQTVSGDRLEEERTGAPFFKVTISVPEETLARLGPSVRLVPGMGAEVMILTEDRTVMDFLFDPLTRSFNRAMRED